MKTRAFELMEKTKVNFRLSLYRRTYLILIVETNAFSITQLEYLIDIAVGAGDEELEVNEREANSEKLELTR